MNTEHDCSCGDCTAADLPVNPFEALRARQGMLLGEDDFRALMGNPRGKQMLHTAWLHGTGVVWGYGVHRDGLLGIVVRPGLAIDGLGRELALASSVSFDLRDWLKRNDHPETQDGCATRTVTACLAAEFACATAHPVPTLADPCDVTRTHDTDSRILEEARLTLVPGECPSCHRHGHNRRLRVLFGLDEAGRRDPAGREAAEARAEVARRPRRERAEAFCHHLDCLAAADAADTSPACREGTDVPTSFPVTEEEAGVVLACVEIDVRDADGCTTIEGVRVSDCCRCVLLSTRTLTELLCALAARVLGRHHHHGHREDDCECGEDDDHGEEGGYDEQDEHGDQGYGGSGHDSEGPGGDAVEGPRVHADDVSWDEDERSYLVPVSADLMAGSVRRAVAVTSLSARGWVEEDVESVRYDAENTRIVVRMATPPQNPVVRLVVKGTGATPVYGAEPAAPLAGVHGGPAGGRHDGHDAVITVTGAMPAEEGS